jgi:hypothetical protein
MALGSTRPLAEISTRNLAGGKGRPVRQAVNLSAIFEPPWSVTEIVLPPTQFYMFYSLNTDNVVEYAA